LQRLNRENGSTQIDLNMQYPSVDCIMATDVFKIGIRSTKTGEKVTRVK